MILRTYIIPLMVSIILLTTWCMTKTTTNQPYLLEPVSSGSQISDQLAGYIVVTGDVAVLTDTYIRTILSDIAVEEKRYLSQLIPLTKSGSLELATNNLLIRVIPWPTPGQESIEIQDKNKRHIAEFPYVERNKKTLQSEECKWEQVFDYQDPLCNLPRVMWLYGPFTIGSIDMIIYTLSQANWLLETRAVSLSNYKDVALPFRPVLYTNNKQQILAREGTGDSYTYMLITSWQTWSAQLANGQKIDWYSIYSGILYAYQFDNDSQNNTSTLRIIDMSTNTIINTIADIDIGQISFFLQDKNNPDTVYVKYNKSFFATEQQKDYLMSIDIKTAKTNWLVQL